MSLLSYDSPAKVRGRRLQNEHTLEKQIHASISNIGMNPAIGVVNNKIKHVARIHLHCCREQRSVPVFEKKCRASSKVDNFGFLAHAAVILAGAQR